MRCVFILHCKRAVAHTADAHWQHARTHTGMATCSAFGSDSWDHASLSAFSLPLAHCAWTSLEDHSSSSSLTYPTQPCPAQPASSTRQMPARTCSPASSGSIPASCVTTSNRHQSLGCWRQFNHSNMITLVETCSACASPSYMTFACRAYAGTLSAQRAHLGCSCTVTDASHLFSEGCAEGEQSSSHFSQ